MAHQPPPATSSHPPDNTVYDCSDSSDDDESGTSEPSQPTIQKDATHNAQQEQEPNNNNNISVNDTTASPPPRDEDAAPQLDQTTLRPTSPVPPVAEQQVVQQAQLPAEGSIQKSPPPTSPINEQLPAPDESPAYLDLPSHLLEDNNISGAEKGIIQLPPGYVDATSAPKAGDDLLENVIINNNMAQDVDQQLTQPAPEVEQVVQALALDGEDNDTLLPLPHPSNTDELLGEDFASAAQNISLETKNNNTTSSIAIDHDDAFASAQENIDKENNNNNSEAPHASPPSVVADQNSSTRDAEDGVDIAREMEKPIETGKDSAYDMRMDIDRKFRDASTKDKKNNNNKDNNNKKKKKNSPSSSSSSSGFSSASSSRSSSVYKPEGERGGRSGPDDGKTGNKKRAINNKSKKKDKSSRNYNTTSSSSSSSTGQEEVAEKEKKKNNNKYVSINTKGGKRNALILEKLPQANMYFVRFMDEEGGSMRVKLAAHNHRKLSTEEAAELEEAMPDTTTERPPRTRVQPKRRPRPRNLLPEPARPEKKSKGPKSTYLVKERIKAESPTSTEEEKRPGYELVGQVIAVRWPSNGALYVALVVGFRKIEGRANKSIHKLFYVVDESTEEVDLSSRDWKSECEEIRNVEWDNSGLVGKRIVVMWQAEYENHNNSNSSNSNSDNDENVPFEAFVVRDNEDGTYRVLYTTGDQLEDRDMTKQSETWELCEEGIWEFDGLPIVSWSTREESEVAPLREEE